MKLSKGDKVLFQGEEYTVEHAGKYDVLIQNAHRRMIVSPITLRKA